MNVGITYDLREDYLAEGYSEEETAEFDRSDTIEAIERTLQDLGFQTDRIGNISNLISRLVAGDRWDLVFNIAEGLRGFGREAQVPAILDAYGIPYTFSDPLVLALTLHKALTKHVMRSMGVPTPDFFPSLSLQNPWPKAQARASTPRQGLQPKASWPLFAEDFCRRTINPYSWRLFCPGGNSQ
jgi:hypothetical protein